MFKFFSGPATTGTRSTPRWTTWRTTRWTACSSQCPRPPTPQWAPRRLSFTFQTTSTTCPRQAALRGGHRRPHPRPHLRVCPPEYWEREVVLIQVACYQIPKHWVFITQSRQTIIILLRCTDRRRSTSSLLWKNSLYYRHLWNYMVFNFLKFQEWQFEFDQKCCPFF